MLRGPRRFALDSPELIRNRLEELRLLAVWHARRRLRACHPTSMVPVPGDSVSVGEQAEGVRGEERAGVVLAEVEPPEAVIPAEGHGAPVERHLGVGVE